MIRAPSARWVSRPLFRCRMCRILLLSSKIRQILSTLQLHSGIDCCLPSYGVPTVFIVCYVAVMWLLCTSPGVWNYVASLYCYSTVISLLSTPPGANSYPARCVSARLFYDCLACMDCTEFLRVARARSNSSVVCSFVNFLSCSTAKDVAIASAISSLVAVYRFI